MLFIHIFLAFFILGLGSGVSLIVFILKQLFAKYFVFLFKSVWDFGTFERLLGELLEVLEGLESFHFKVSFF